ncbi:MAG: SulP family inorganic anion transporter [Rhodocyclaceae bacterium]
MQAFRPKLFQTLRTYTRGQFGADLSAGITVGVLALPLAMAFAIASGASPSSGIWTAIVAGLLISIFGGSRVQIGGPTGAFIPILYAIVATHGVPNMLAATFMAGILLVAMGATGLGTLIRFIPVAVVIGFTNGIAIVIFLSQVKDFFGLGVTDVPAEFFARMRVLMHYAPTVDGATVAVAIVSVLVILGWGAAIRRLQRAHARFKILEAIPPQLAVLLVMTPVCALLALPVETIGSRFGGIPQGLPALTVPLPSIERLGSLISPAITIALLGAIESLLSARVADNYVDDRHDPNQELMGQGIANILAPFFGGVAATGAIARTSANVRAGGRTPVAGIIHSVTLLLIVLIAAPLAAYVPIATLAAIVMVVAVRMGEWHEFKRLRQFSWSYRITLVATFAMTVLFDLTVAVEIGMVLASLFFIYRMQTLTMLEPLERAGMDDAIRAWSLRGSLFFGAVAKLERVFDPLQVRARVVVFDMHRVLNVDSTGVDWLAGVQRALAKQGCTLILCGLEMQPQSIAMRSGLYAQVEMANVCADLSAALRRGNDILDGN